MKADLWPKVSAALDQVFDLPAEQRDAFLNQLRQEDAEVCSEVESLLRHEHCTDRFDSDPKVQHLLDRGNWDGVRGYSADNESTIDLTHASPGFLQPSGPLEIPGYEILDELGHGGMGVVYKVRHLKLNRVVALKIPKLEAPDAEFIRSRFLREAQAAAALNHPHICPIHDLGEINGIPYLTMPIIDGLQLSQKIAEGPLPLTEAIRLAHQVADALQVAHGHGVIHRDLKPDNILLDQLDQPIIMDFGLARRADLSGTTLTAVGQIMGTPPYMPPEQFNGDIDAMGPASDIWSLGVVLYEMLTGVKPFRGGFLTLAAQIAHDMPAPPSQSRPFLDPVLDTIVLRALQKKPGDRWPSMQAFAEALDEYQSNQPTDARMLGGSEDRGFEPSDTHLILRIKDTPYLYRPAPGQTLITVGRQRRKPGQGRQQGNDFVVRVSGNDELSQRISRRHFEIRREGENYVVVDFSKHGLLCNGAPVPSNKPIRLQPGDVLRIAGVMEMEVLLQQQLPDGVHRPVVQVLRTGGADHVQMEASLGDMMTLE